MKKLIILIALCAAIQSEAQQFIAKGKIEFERKINNHKQFEGEDDSWVQELKKQIPQFGITYFNFYFNDTASVYKPGREVDAPKNGFFGSAPASENVVYSNYTNHTTASQKQVFETQYLIQDSIKNFEWKLTSDTRKIAGFLCRKATTIINDSVFIFAYYTDEILCQGGPEGFNGLPGMILGIAIPRIGYTYFATKLELAEIPNKEFLPPTKGKKTTAVGMRDKLKESLKDWGKWGERNIWLCNL
ncbi:MAG: GLPGLI family protein [Chitinophagaceae bacterium]|uniref:GLPGLI family protein n=1 Tax=unclassified Paraflavitalea TaxID=2798305 RepID=UPI003D32A037|nr:GLPGLI family protein [Chitinophagaceae bacterium]